MVKRIRARPKLKAAGGAADEALVPKNSPKPEAASRRSSYLPPRMSKNTHKTPPKTPRASDTPVLDNRKVMSPRSPATKTRVRSPVEESLPARVFFPSNTHSEVPMDDSVTIDSGLDNKSRAKSQASANVYHLAPVERGIRKPSPRHRAKLEAWYRKNGKHTTVHAEESVDPGLPQYQSPSHPGSGGFDESQYQPSFGHTLSSAEEQTAYTGYSFVTGQDTADSGDYADSIFKGVRSDDDEEDYLKTKQEIALLSIGLTSIQLLMICLQFTMCGIAPFDVNPAVGPYPDAFSDWGGKNGYLMLHNNEYWRLISPCALSVGILHLLGNAFCQLEPIAIFEREWGSFRWFLIYLLSAVGSNALSVYMDPDTIAVGSSGPLMGLFAAKLAQVLTHMIFEVKKANQDEFIRLDQLSSIFCGLLILSVLAFFSFIDWSGHLGGLLAGFFSGMVLFAAPIRSCCARFFWTFLGLTGLVLFLTACVYLLLTEADPSEDLEDPCYYFRSVYHISHDCGCIVQS